MSKRTKARVAWLFVFTTVMIPADLALLGMLRADSVEIPAKWADQLTGTQRAAAVTKIHRYPIEFRRALMAVSSPNRRAQAWQGVIDRYVGEHPELLPSQRSAISQARAFLTPTLFTGQVASAETRSEIDAITQAVIAQLGKSEAATILYSMGPETSTEALPLSVRLSEWATRRTDAQAYYPCDCSLQSDWCSQAAHCDWPGYCDVIEPWPACGTWGMYNCDGLCRY